MKLTRRGLFGLIAGALVGTKAKPLIRGKWYVPGGAAMRYPISVTKILVKTRPRRLKAKWSVEAQQDLMVLRGLSADQELRLI